MRIPTINICLIGFYVLLSFETHGQAQVTYLANEGVLIQGGSHKILIDALFNENHGIYQLVPDAIQKHIIEGNAPFDGIDYFLITHNHKDHFSDSLIVKFIHNHPKTKILAPLQVCNQILDEVNQRNIMPLELRLHDSIQPIVKGPVNISAAWLKHPFKKNEDVMNLLYVIDINHCKIAHFGDSEFIEKNFMASRINKVRLDLALVPIWFISKSESKKIENFIDASHFYGIHTIKGFQSDYPIFRKPLESVSLKCN